MDTIECLLSRKSIRNFTKKEVPDDIIRKLIECGINAPCGGNNQCWKFIILPAEIIDEMRYFVARRKDLSFADFFNAPTVISVFITHTQEFFNKDRYRPIGNPGYATGFACVQNILLAAHALGIGACWCKPIPERDRIIREKFNIDYTLVANIAIGYYDESKNHPKPKRKNVNEYILYWDKEKTNLSK